MAKFLDRWEANGGPPNWLMWIVAAVAVTGAAAAGAASMPIVAAALGALGTVAGGAAGNMRAGVPTPSGPVEVPGPTPAQRNESASEAATRQGRADHDEIDHAQRTTPRDENGDYPPPGRKVRDALERAEARRAQDVTPTAPHPTVPPRAAESDAERARREGRAGR